MFEAGDAEKNKLAWDVCPCIICVSTCQTLASSLPVASSLHTTSVASVLLPLPHLQQFANLFRAASKGLEML